MSDIEYKTPLVEEIKSINSLNELNKKIYGINRIFPQSHHYYYIYYK